MCNVKYDKMARCYDSVFLIRAVYCRGSGYQHFCLWLYAMILRQRRLDREPSDQIDQSARPILQGFSRQQQAKENQNTIKLPYFSIFICKFSSKEMHILAEFDLLFNMIHLLPGNCPDCFCISLIIGSPLSHAHKQSMRVCVMLKRKNLFSRVSHLHELSRILNTDA